ncbi:hypothetical protein HF285_07775 [Acidithiobacillus ferrooxidans F221]|uniref:hypothetical protein n=1 Tax=Acidithiobacillus ferrooxidans TaxID=920 RepID=UPI001C073412|nr:hypothetical protein [Acidithiobacillus ferrooxidans]MBU2808158.1 hypothetical protein [Acidithiobacillus ferrooxidans F221]
MSIGQGRRSFWVLFILLVTLQLVTGLLMAWDWAGLPKFTLPMGSLPALLSSGNGFWPWKAHSLLWPRRCG